MEKISLQEIKIFLLVAKYKNFSKAAEVMYIAQPTVTKWIHHLEDELGMPLFERTSRSVTLTPAGELLAYRWKTLLAEMESSIHDAKQLADQQQSTIYIGGLVGMGYESFVSDYIVPFEKLNPQIKLELTIYNHRELHDQTENLDLILTTNFEFSNESKSDYTVLMLDELPVYLAVSKDNPLASHTSVTMEEIKDLQFLIYHPRTSQAAIKIATDVFTSAGISPAFMTAENLPSQLMKISQDQGVSIVASSEIKGYENEIVLLPVTDLPVHLQRLLIYRTQKISTRAKKFCTYLSQKITQNNLQNKKN